MPEPNVMICRLEPQAPSVCLRGAGLPPSKVEYESPDGQVSTFIQTCCLISRAGRGIFSSRASAPPSPIVVGIPSSRRESPDHV
jgi:hypothetical protein